MNGCGSLQMVWLSFSNSLWLLAFVRWRLRRRKMAGRRMPATVIGKAFGFKQSTFKSICNRYRNHLIPQSLRKWIQATMQGINAADPKRYGQWSASEFDRMLESKTRLQADRGRSGRENWIQSQRPTKKTRINDHGPHTQCHEALVKTDRRSPISTRIAFNK